MSLAWLLTGIFFILYGIAALGLIAIPAVILGLVALVAGIAWLIEGYRPITLWRRQ